MTEREQTEKLSRCVYSDPTRRGGVLGAVGVWRPDTMGPLKDLKKRRGLPESLRLSGQINPDIARRKFGV